MNKTTTITMPEELLVEVDINAKEQKVSRSEWIRQAIDYQFAGEPDAPEPVEEPLETAADVEKALEDLGRVLEPPAPANPASGHLGHKTVVRQPDGATICTDCNRLVR